MGRTTTSKSKIKAHKAIETRTDFFYYAFRNILLVSLPLALISALILSLPHSSAYSSSTDNVSLTLPSACTISASVIEGHNATIVNGQKEDDIGNTKINAHCNDTNGYFIYAIGTSGDTDGNTDLIFNNGINDNYNIHTGIYSTSSTNSSWAMKLSSNNGIYAPIIMSGYDSYSEVPSTDTIVAYKTSGTSMDPNTDATGSYFNTTYEIYANTLQPAGTYLGKVKYTMTHPYDSSSLPNMENAFDIAGKDKVTVTDPVTGITGSYYKMQDMSERICNLTKVYGELSATRLADVRDNKLYWVAKLDDGHCWMTQNLDLDITAGSTALTSQNTDLSSDQSVYTANNTIYALKGSGDTYGYTYENGIATWIPERSTIAYDQLNSTTWPNSNVYPYSYDRLDTTTGANNGKPVYPDSNVSQAIAGDHGLSGNYYNWTASIASNDSNNASSANPDQTNSICPKGWRLPSVTNKEFGNLLVQYGIISTNTSTSYIENQSSVDSMGAAPLYLVRGGYVDGGSLNVSGSLGYYWSSTFYSTSRAYHLRFDSSNVLPQNDRSRLNGFSIRCVARSQ